MGELHEDIKAQNPEVHQIVIFISGNNQRMGQTARGLGTCPHNCRVLGLFGQDVAEAASKSYSESLQPQVMLVP